MAGSCRFAFAVHILSVLALKRNEGVTSEELAGSVNTNPVVIRRIVSALQHAGLVTTVKGARGGVKLAAPPDRVSLRAIYRAIEAPPTLAGHRQKPNPRCPVGGRIELVLDEVFASAQAALEDALSRRSVADVIETISHESKIGRRAKRVHRPTVR
jgi:Rrf2 family protein